MDSQDDEDVIYVETTRVFVMGATALWAIGVYLTIGDTVTPAAPTVGAISLGRGY